MASIADRMRSRARAMKRVRQTVGERTPRLRPRVPQGDETARILALPTYDPAAAPDLTEELRRDGGRYRLKPLQNLALWQLREAQGFVGQMPVGTGKTWVGLLAPTVLDARNALYLTPANTVLPVLDAYRDLNPHWRLVRPERLKVMSYAMISRASAVDLFDRERFDLLILDEAHYLRNPKAARTKRVMRAVRSHPGTRVLVMSGTLTTKSLLDFAHLSDWALRERNPLPRRSRELLAWSNVIDTGTEASEADWRIYNRYAGRPVSTVAEARRVFQARFERTPGVVVGTSSSVDCALYFRHRKIDPPPDVSRAIEEAARSWARPDGEEFESALDLWRYQKQLCQGFWYRWVWPDGKEDREWIEARRQMAREVRRVLEMDISGIDSPMLVRNALLEQRIYDPALAQAWNAWSQHRNKPPPPTEVVWIDDYLVAYAAAWLAKPANRKGLIWYSDKGMADALEAAGVPTFRAGEVPPLDGSRGMALSVAAHGTGLNLQRHHKNLLLAFPSSGKTVEQLVGRTHRYGQQADEVDIDFVCPGPTPWRWIAKARSEAHYISQASGSPQKLLYGTWIVGEGQDHATFREILAAESE